MRRPSRPASRPDGGFESAAKPRLRQLGSYRVASSAMRLGVVILPEHRWSEAQALWRHAEELGFDHAWTYDHLAWRTLRDSGWFATVPTLTAAALATERIRLGTLVASPNFRHPVTFAKEVMTLDDISGGRITVGIGAGGFGWDSTMLGQEPLSPPKREDRFEEFVELADRLLRGGAVNFRGEFYFADEARMYPGSVQLPRPPLAIAATGPRGMGLAARYAETWVTTGDGRGETNLDPIEGGKVIAGQVKRLEDACSRAGREPSTMARLLLTGVGIDSGLQSPSSFVEVLEAYEQAGISDLVVHWPRSGPPYQGEMARFEECIASVRGGRPVGES